MTAQVKKRRILLIEPPFYRLFKDTYALARQPLSLTYLAAALGRDSDWDVLVYNSDFCQPSEPFQVSRFTGVGFLEYKRGLSRVRGGVWDEIRSVLTDYSPAVVGVTIKAPMLASALNTARLVKEVDPAAVVIVGGPHVTLDPDSVMTCPDMDIAVVGEGERTIVELVSALEKGADLSGINGLVYRKNGTIIKTPPRELADDLDELASPHEFTPRVLKDYGSYPPEALGRVMTVRGCPNNCLFCGSRAVWGRRVRFRSPDNVVGELRLLKKRGVSAVHFEDDTFGVNSSRLRRLTEALTHKSIGISWSCETHVNLVSEETLSMMKNAGCFSIQIGIESGDDNILKTVRKGFSVDRALKACELIKEAGLRLETFFMAGFPDETEESLRKTYRVMQTVPADKLIFSLFTPYPGTEVFDLCRSRGLIQDGFDPSLHHHQSPLNCFCSSLKLERFRDLAGEMEEYAVERNRLGRNGT